MKLDFFARRVHFIDHLAPVWNKLPADVRGEFYVPAFLLDHAKSHGIDAHGLERPGQLDSIDVIPPGRAPLVTCAYGDMAQTQRGYVNRPKILMEHGVGLTFKHPGYAGGFGLRTRVNMFLAPNEFIRAKTAQALPQARQEIIGTPKLDEYIMPDTAPKAKKKPVVAISFHWDGSRVAPEAGNAFKHYQHILPSLARERGFRLIGHGHPKYIHTLRHYYEDAGIEVVEDFRDVMAQADLYVNDCSSTMYEFCVTGKPVVILNAPWFRKFVNYGIRFWLWTDIGPQVENADGLLQAIESQLSNPGEYFEARKKTVAELYPYLGQSAQRAADALVTHFGK